MCAKLHMQAIKMFEFAHLKNYKKAQFLWTAELRSSQMIEEDNPKKDTTFSFNSTASNDGPRAAWLAMG